MKRSPRLEVARAGRRTTRMWATSTPSSASRSETQGPLRSVIRAVITSVPVTRIPARTVSVPALTGSSSRAA